MKYIKKINEFVSDLNYEDLIKKLDRETLLISSSSDIKQNENYKKLLSIGERLIPNLFDSLKENNNISICMLISDITGIEPPNEIGGDINKLKEFYLNEFN